MITSRVAPAPPTRMNPLQVALTAFVGTSIEWYDFYLYATAAALVFGKLFFPTFDPLTGTLAAFATYAVGFLARPLGGIVFGHLGDLIGRKKSLVGSLLMMGGGTFLVGLLPPYQAIGVLATVLLVALRFVQGLAVGGEWGGAVLIAVEHAPPARRTFYGAFAQLGSPAGLLLSTVMVTLFTGLPEDAFLAWGWRVPFLLSAVLIVVGLVVRLRISESPEFLEAQRRREQAESIPLVETLRTAWLQVLLGLCAIIVSIGGFYIVNTFMLAYATDQLGMPRGVALTGQIVVAIVEGVTLLGFAWLGDRIGRRPVAVAGGVFTAVWAIPLFGLADTRQPVLLWVGMGVGILGITATYAVVAALVAHMFTVRTRYTGISLAYQLSGVVGGGLMPLLAAYLLRETGGSATPAVVLLIAMSLLTAGAAWLAGEQGARRAPSAVRAQAA